MDWTALRRRIEATGLIARGGFHPEPEDGVPGEPGTLVLLGNAGPGMWAAFSRARREEADPLDNWTRRIVIALARELGARALFPFGGPPYLPFQRWAMKAEAVRPSPIGPLIHPDYGLWHAYRGALAFEERLTLPAPDRRPSPCESCADKPCLTSCPVKALAPGAYDVPACVDHISSMEGADCLETGCRARRACPVGRESVYVPAQAGFHMGHFRRAQSGT